MYNKLNDYSVHYLRTMARNLNIKSPTTMKKAQLIEKISEYNLSEIKKSKRKTRLYFESGSKEIVENVIEELENLKCIIDLYLNQLKNTIEK